MTVERNIFFRHVNIYDKELEVSHALPGQPECFIRRTSYDDIYHYGGVPDEKLHPTLPHIHENVNLTNFFINGTMEFEWGWTSTENYTESQLDSYINLVANPFTTFSKDMQNKKMTATINIGGIQYSEWSDRLFRWNLKSPMLKVTMISEDAEYVCITPLYNPLGYTQSQRTIEPGESTFIEKLGNECYVLFTRELSKGDVVLNAVQLYKLTSGDITLTNNSGFRARIIRLYK